MNQRVRWPWLLLFVCFLAGFPGTRSESSLDRVGLKPSPIEYPELTCLGVMSPEEIVAETEAALARGKIADPASWLPVRIPEPDLTPRGGGCLPTVYLHGFEDSAAVLTTDFSFGELFSLMAQAHNSAIATYGDHAQFTGYWINYIPDHTLSAAFYSGLVNDVDGIGINPFNIRSQNGFGGNQIEGVVMMWHISEPFWQPGTAGNAFYTRTVLGQEFEHRFGMSLGPLPGGRLLQGDDANCGRNTHRFQHRHPDGCLQLHRPLPDGLRVRR